MPGLSLFHAPYAPADEEIAARLLSEPFDEECAARAEPLARRLLAAMRSPKGIGNVERLLQEYSLSTREGIALMALAESLLRVPDDATLDLLIADKLAAGAFDRHAPASDALLVQATAFALGLSTKIFAADETPRGLVAQAARRLGAPALRGAARQAMRLMGGHFVLGETIDEALARAAEDGRRWRYSFDMLGEGARSAADADRYFRSYAEAIVAIGAKAGTRALPERAGVSVKLSALHPRFEPSSRERVLRELAPRLLELARLARQYDLVFTVDAEEADRLELSLDVIGAVVADSSLAGWDGFGLAVQAYQKRAAAVIDHVEALAEAHGRRFMLRLVKGAYWDTEVKRAQERGLSDYPVFTRKAMTDLNYLACADRLLAAPRIFPQFATHNAATVAAIVARAGDPAHYEFQRLHGMGEELFETLLDEGKGASCRVYAPVGPHRDLLAYLVRRLIENGANSSFVARAADAATPERELLAPPRAIIGEAARARHSRLPLPADLYRPLRANSKGVEFGDREALAALIAERDARASPITAASSAGRSSVAPRDIRSPIDESIVGSVIEADNEAARAAMAAAARAFPAWEATPVKTRAAIVERAADLVEARRGRLIALLQEEGGKTLDDALAEAREAADLCRYYAEQARLLCEEDTLPGPTGEENSFRRRGRGVFICISPWNFPLAIFLGQVAAALVAGNAAVAKPAEQTPLVAREAVALLHDAGVPREALQYVPGDGAIGAELVAHPHVAGVVFTGSTEAAQSIHRTLAASSGPIVPLIAETGGVNAMIVDSTALPEQVVDDVIVSAFRSAGQRCSALRLLCLQEDIAQATLAMLTGAAQELRVGDPREISTHVGPVIDGEAKARLEDYIARRRAEGRVLYAGEAPQRGNFVAPHIIRLDRAGDLREEIFGPVLHVATWRAQDEEDLLRLIEEIAANGFGLTMGLQTRIEARIRALAEATPAGNLYVNRNMIGAVVGGQPFGGSRMSGTGPKAGGPDYLRRFLREETVTINTASFGGDARLLAMKE